MSLSAYLLTCVFNYPTKPISFEPTFFNLSHIKSLDQHSKLFHLGLKHVPIPRSVDSSTIQQSWKLTKSKLLWKEYFAYRQSRIASDYNHKLKITKPSTPFPDYLTNQNGILPSLMGIQQVIDTLSHQLPQPTATTELATLKNIRNTHPHVIFTSSDKNLGLCALHVKDYHSLAMMHLQDDTKYEFIYHDLPTVISSINIRSILHLFRKMTKQEHDFLLFEREFSLPKFHLLPKVHKSTIKLQTRPIIGATNWCTTPASVLFDDRLQQHLPKFTAVLRNSQDLVKCLENIPLLHANDWLVTMDVISLYPNIDLDLLNQVLNELDNSFLAISNFITRNNYFVYNKQIFRQKNGIAMGTNCAVNLAQIYLGSLLDTYLTTYSGIKLYKRYIDDMFAIFNGSEQDLIAFFAFVNSLVPCIKITFTYSKSTTEFLDLKIFTEPDGSIAYCTHQKSQNKYHYLSPRSCHPRHTLSGYIKGELIRYARNSSQSFYFEHTKQLFLNRLLVRGFPKAYLEQVFLKVSYNHVVPGNSERTKVTALVLPYSVQPLFNALTKTLKQLFVELNQKFQTIERLKDFRILLVFKRNASIGDILCRSALTEFQSNLLLAKDLKSTPGPKPGTNEPSEPNL